MDENGDETESEIRPDKRQKGPFLLGWMTEHRVKKLLMNDEDMMMVVYNVRKKSYKKTH